jgi:ribosome maturation factor RimP
MVTKRHFANFGEVGFRPPFFSPASRLDFMSRNPQHDRLIAIIEPVCVDAGFELADVRLLMEQGGWVLRVSIDRPLPEGADVTQVHEERVDLSECEEVSRLLSAALDVDDPIPQAYSLEISSPGIDRPLRTPAHFVRYAGAEVKIQLAAPLVTQSGERRNFRGVLLGCSGAAGQAVVSIEVDGAATFELPIDDIESARIVPDWDEVMRGGSGVTKPKSQKGEAKARAAKAAKASKPTRSTKAGSADSSSEDSQGEAHGASPDHSPDVPSPDHR